MMPKHWLVLALIVTSGLYTEIALIFHIIWQSESGKSSLFSGYFHFGSKRSVLVFLACIIGEYRLALNTRHESFIQATLKVGNKALTQI